MNWEKVSSCKFPQCKWFLSLFGGGGLNLGKAKLKALIVSFGGRVTSSVSGKTNILVVGKNPGYSKVSKARRQPNCKLMSLKDLTEYFEGDKTVNDNLGKVTIDSEKAPLTVSHIEKLDWWLTKHGGGLVECDFLRFEDLSNEWRRYGKQLKIKHPLPHKNGSGLIPITSDRKKWRS